VFPTHYSIRAEAGRDSHPRNWVLEGSLDGETWTELDRKTDDSQITRRLMIVDFKVSNPEKVRMIRFRQTDRNHLNSYYLALTAVEFYGDDW
jgi:hypothetical protein